jgi:energy-coupling factor transport system ATP-binding protein
LPDAVGELVSVWHDTRLIVLVAQIAAVYAAILIPFKMGIPLIPGFSELRPANAVPVVASLLFGPAAAWGSGFGNLIGDCFGTLGPASLFGFLGNFFYGYTPYLLWGRLGPLSSGLEPEPRSPRQILEFVLVCFVASSVCALVVAWGVDLLGLLPFRILAPAIFVNNFFLGTLLAPPLLLFLYPRVKRWGLRYRDIRASDQTWQPQPTTAPATEFLPEEWLTVRAATFTYAGESKPALDGLSFTARSGESVALMGRTGAGKSTLCYTLNGLIPHHVAGHWSGQVKVAGHDTGRRPVWQQADTVGLVFQDFEAQLVSTNVEMELAFPLEYARHAGRRGQQQRRLTPAEMRNRIARTLALVGLSGLERRNPLSLSGGQRQRLVIASILIREPALVALDEPLTDLDPIGRRELLALFVAMKTAGATVMTAEHDPEVAAGADRICVLDHGAVVWEGRPHDLFGRTSRADRGDFVARYGISPLPLARCFAGLGLPDLPLTAEEAWRLADREGLILSPSKEVSRPVEPRKGAPLVEVRRVSYDYPNGTSALADLSLTISDGEFVAVIGENGSGKSTLAKLLNGLHVPTRGRVRVEGQDTGTLRAGQLAARIGYVFQNPDHQIFAETVGAEVSFGVRNLGFPPDECDKRVAAALDAVGLAAPEIRNLDPFSLTKGDRQRVAVASVLAARPRILIFDEPTTGLDAYETDRMMRMIQRLNREGHTIIMITHVLSLVAAYAHRCVVLRAGRIVADGPTRQVFRTLLAPEEAAALGLEVPPLTRFAARWGHTLLTVEEVRAALRRR